MPYVVPKFLYINVTKVCTQLSIYHLLQGFWTLLSLFLMASCDEYDSVSIFETNKK